MKIIEFKCPHCGADLTVEEGRSTLFCQYCGSRVEIQNDNEIVYRVIDEASIAKADSVKTIKLKELSLREKAADKESSRASIKLSVLAALLIISVATTVLVIFLSIKTNFDDDRYATIILAGLLFSTLIGCQLFKK